MKAHGSATLVELYGPGTWRNSYNETFDSDEECTRFAYFARMNPDPDYDDPFDHPMPSDDDWWTRSASAAVEDRFREVFSWGYLEKAMADVSLGVVPCFCL